MRHDYALKSALKHRLLAAHFPMTAFAIARGRVLADRPRHLTILYEDRAIFGTWFHLTIKASSDGSEVWVVSFRKTNSVEAQRRYRRDPIVRS
jgi:hypothetical protein